MDGNGQSHGQLYPREPLAIVGMACRFPGDVVDVESFWELLASARSGIAEIPADRWNKDRYYHRDTAIPNRMHSKWCGSVDQLHDFDARFWGISPREAARMDPQQRWLLEVAWEAIEDAGIAPAQLGGSNTGVFVGISSSDYAQIQMTNHFGLDVHSNSGNTLSIASNRISYSLDLKGPSVSVDTACSSSLVAVWLACRSIWDGTCDTALVGGSNAVIVPSTTMAFSKATMLSPDGQCFAFDSRANGYVRGDGAAVVMIKKLADAVRDGDRIYAMIRAAVANQDGKTSSMMVPSVQGQSAMLEQAYREAGISPSRVSYVEAHGTGTPMGDPIEATALGNVLSRGRNQGEPCLVGSVKTNIGHLEAGSGMAGFIKAVLILHKRLVPPNRNFVTPNPSIPFDQLKLEIPTQLRPLPTSDGAPPVTAVNSFGFGGTNAHVVLEAAPLREDHLAAATVPKADRPCLLPISARDDNALHEYIKRYRRLLRDESISLADLSYAAGARKEHHSQRLAVVGASHDAMREQLSLWMSNPEEADGVVAGNLAGHSNRCTFVFTGQGPQWWGMGQQLLAREPVFRETIEKIDHLFSKLANWSLLEEMRRNEATSQVEQTHIAQPAIFGLQVALAELWRSWGIVPSAVIGHSVGEVAGAYCAGIYTMEDAVKIAYHRSRLQHSTRGTGRMLAAGICAAEARQRIGDLQDRVHVSAINSPSLITLSGDTEPLESIAENLKQSDKFFRWLGIDYAFHSHQMDPIRDELLETLSDLHPRSGSIPFYSTVTGGLLLGEKLDAHYWWKNVRLPVLFAPALSQMIDSGIDLFVEVGPHPSLQSSIEDCLSASGRRGAVYHSLRRNTDESHEILTNLAGMYVRGVPVDWASVNQSSGQVMALPRYPWTHESHWLESNESSRNRLADQVHPLLGLPIDAVQPTWEFLLDPRLFPYIRDHQIWGSIVFPAAGFGEIGLALARELFPEQPHVVEGIEIKKALFAFDDKITTVRVVVNSKEKSFSVYSATGDQHHWELNAQGYLMPLAADAAEPLDLERVRASLTEYCDHERYYADLVAAGYGFGPNFRHVQNVWRKPGEALAEIEVPDELATTLSEYHFHPAVLDACFQVFRAARVVTSAAQSDYLFLPSEIRRIRLYRDKPPKHFWAHARQTFDDGKSLICDIHVYDDQGGRVADILGFRVDPMERKSGNDDVENCLYQFRWELCRLRGTGADGSCKFKSTAEIAAAADKRAGEFYEQFGIADYTRDFLPRSKKLICQYVENAFLKLGWKPETGDLFSFADFVRQLGIVRRHQRVARIQLTALEESGTLRAVGVDRWEVMRPLAPRQPENDMAALAADYPRLAATEIALSKLNGEAAAELLTGEIAATEILFPGGSAKRVGQFYVDGLDFPVHNRLIPIAVAKAIEDLPAGRALRILEIGAGTGSLTKELLPVLPADRVEYLFTDIGPAFLTAARSQFADYSFIDYKTFDLEKPASEQGLSPHGYDLILASAVLHATEDLRRTLANIQWCLADDGLLIFLEPIHRRMGTDIIFGGLPGWWKFTDTDLRPEHALMERAKWEWLLADCGFRDVQSVLSAPHEDESEQATLIAVAPTRIEEPTSNVAPAPVDTMTHLVFADAGGVADSMIKRIRQSGQRAVRIGLGDHFQQIDDDSVVIAPESEEDLRQLITGLGPIKSITHCFSLQHPTASGMTLEELRNAQQTGVLHALRLVHVLNDLAQSPPPRVYFVTRGVQKVVDADESASLSSAPLVAFARVANAEHAQLRFTSIDLDAEGSGREGELLLRELIAGDKELEIAFRDDRRYANRLHRVRPTDLPKRTRPAVDSDGSITPFRLQMEKPGVLEHLSLNETRRPDPASTQIEVRVHAGGINFRDVMKALGMYPGNPIDLKWFGDDFAGTVSRVGDNVTQYRVGDRVAGIAPYCFRTYALTDWRTVFRLPDELAFEGAATLPTVFLTAHYAIERLAHMRSGESILIHAATGGVGQAAVQVAQSLGLQIFATAGTPEKRQLLADWGVPHIMDSRTLAFADEIMDLTHGRGVDAVLNSLAGPFVAKSISVLAPFGRFLEIGKVDVYGKARIGLDLLKQNISYFVIDLAQCLQEKPEWVADMFATLAEKFRLGEYRPLSYTVFPVSDVADAFRYMAQGKHTGKNVLQWEGVPVAIGPCTEEGHLFRPDACYLVTGGAGGFGLECAKWMARQGARHLVLMSRTGPRDVGDQTDITHLRAAGVNVIIAHGDVTRPDDVQRILQDIKGSLPPLRGVIHGAMVLDDGFLADLDDDQFNRALYPKMLGAWNLHQETLGMPLDHFICFSSFSAVAGGAKQANYNAGNMFLDCLAAYRKQLGLSATTINWGGISGAGFVHRNEKIGQYFEKIGFQSFTIEEALRVMRLLLQTDPGQIAVARLNWQNMERFSPFVSSSNMYGALTRDSANDVAGGSALPRILAAPPDERLGLVKALLSGQLAAVCNIDVAKVDHETSIIRLGLDSLMAIELINRVETELGLVIPMGKVLGGPTLSELSETVVQLLAYAADDVSGSAGTTAAGSSTHTLIGSPHDSLEPFPQSEGQQALWFLQRFGNADVVNHTTFAARIRQPLDVRRLDQALQAVLQRQPMLNRTFADADTGPVQRVHSAGSCVCRQHDLTDMPVGQIEQTLAEHANDPFDLKNGPVVRLELFQLADGSQRMLFCAHRLVADSRSMAILVEELFEVYQTLEAGGQPDLSPARVSLANFVAWEKNYLASEASQRSLLYWKEQLAGAPTSLRLPIDGPRPDQLTFAGTSFGFQVSDELAQKLMLLAAEQDVPLRSTLLAAYQLLLHGLCGQQDLLVGYSMPGRDHDELRDAVGYFSNPVALRSRIEPNMTFVEFLKRTDQTMNDASQHQRYPLPRLMARLGLQRDHSRWPLCQVAFGMHRDAARDPQGVSAFLIGQGGHRIRMSDRTLEAVDLPTPFVPAEMMLNMEEAGGCIVGRWHFNRSLLQSDSMDRIAQQFMQLLMEIVADPCQSMEQFQLANVKTNWLARVPMQEPSAPCTSEVAADRAADHEESTIESDDTRYVAPRSDTEHRVARIWEDLLEVRPIGVQDDFFALGGHSLDLTVTCARLYNMFSVEIPLEAFLADSTVQGLAKYIESHRGADAPPIMDPTELEFEGDTQLDPTIVAPDRRDFVVDDAERVLLTGSTGFLGAFLLDELLRQTGAEVVCLVRASSPRQALQRIHKNMEKYGLDMGESADRVIPLVGDLARPRLGLSQEQFDQLASEIDVIYHNGAVLNFAYPYRVLRDSNVCGTHEVLRLAFQTRLKPTHYVSTVAVLASTERRAMDVVREDDPLPPFTSLRDAYSQTKWVSEKLMTAAKERGLPVTIYRPGGITGHSETGYSNTGDLVHVMALGCYHLGTIPQLDVEFNLSPVDFIAAALIELSRRRECLGRTFHLVNPQSLRLETLANWVNRAELPVERMSFGHWSRQVAAHVEALPSDVFGLLTKSFMPGVLTGDMNDAIPAVLKLRYDCAHASEELSNTNLRCRRVDDDLLSLYFSRLRRFGLVLASEGEEGP